MIIYKGKNEPKLLHPNSLKCYLVEGGYISQMPRDPKFYDDGNACGVPTNSYGYAYCSDGGRFFFCTRLERDCSSTKSALLY